MEMHTGRYKHTKKWELLDRAAAGIKCKKILLADHISMIILRAGGHKYALFFHRLVSIIQYVTKMEIYAE